MKENDENWHALMVAGVLYSENRPTHWLCRQSWQDRAPFVGLPIFSGNEVSRHRHFLSILTPNEDVLQENQFSITSDVMVYHDGPAQPDEYSDSPRAFRSSHTLKEKLCWASYHI